jgi:putative redox protein
MTSNLRFATLTWAHDLVFKGGAPGGPAIVIDADSGDLGPSPVVTLLLAAAACSGADVVLILEKMRAGLTALRIETRGTRCEDDPKRCTALHFSFHLSGTQLDQACARRAIDLSIGKYCSVLHSLAPDIAITYDLQLS